MIQVSCVKIHCLWLHPVAVIWFARIYLYLQLNTTNQSQGQFYSLYHSCAYAAGSPPPSRTYLAVLFPHAGTVPLPFSYLVRYFHAQIRNNGGE